MPDTIAHVVPYLTVQELEADPHGVFRRYRPARGKDTKVR